MRQHRVTRRLHQENIQRQYRIGVWRKRSRRGNRQRLREQQPRRRLQTNNCGSQPDQIHRQPSRQRFHHLRSRRHQLEIGD